MSQSADAVWSVWYGTSGYTDSTPVQTNGGGAAAGIKNVAIDINGLQPGTIYHYQAVVTAPTYWASSDMTFTTRPLEPPVLQFLSPPGCDGAIAVGAGLSCQAAVFWNTKGLDTSWYVTAATRPDFSDAVSGTPVAIPAYECDCFQQGAYGTDVTPYFPAPASDAVYMQLHASNAAGTFTSPVVTVSPVLLPPPTPTTTSLRPPPPNPTTATTTTRPATTTARSTTTALTTTAATTTTTTTPPLTLGRSTRLQARTKTHGCRRGAEPDRRCSPGAYYSGLTKAVLCSDSFRTGSIRYVPDSEKHRVESEYGLAPKSYGRTLEIDQLISVELGGSNDISNLFPEPGSGRADYHAKDRLENRLHAMLCAGQISLHDAQHQIASDWEKLYAEVFGSALRH